MKNLSFLGFPNYAVTRDGRVFSLYSNKFLKQYLKKDGYYQVVLYDTQHKRKDFRVSRLVALAYITNPDNLLQVNHKDGNKHNNHYTNLEWCIAQQNTIHSFINGFQKFGRHKITDVKDVHTVCKLLEEGYRVKDISDMLDIKINTVSGIKQKQRWKYISDEYDFSKVTSKYRMAEEKVLKICELLEQKHSCKKIAKKMNIPKQNVINIYKRRTYTTYSQNFDW